VRVKSAPKSPFEAKADVICWPRVLRLATPSGRLRQAFTWVKGTTCATRSCGSDVGFQQEPAEEGDEVPLDGRECQ